MSPWWEKSSSKEEEKKGNREGIIGTIRRKLSKSRRSRNDTISEKGPRSLVPSGSSASSTRVSHCLSFADRPLPQPLPLPGTHLHSANYANSGTSATSNLESARGLKTSQYFPLRKPGCVSKRQEPTNAKGDIAIASVYSDSSLDSDDQCESHFHSPLAFDREYGNQANTHNTFRSAVHRNQSPIAIQNNSRVSSKAAPQLSNHQYLSNKHKGTRLYVPSPQMDSSGGLRSAPESSKTSPSISPPIRRFGSEQVLNSGFYTGRPHTDIASGHSSSPGSCHNSVGRDLLGQSRYSPEYSPIPSPGMTSPGLSSSVHSGAVTPIHPRSAALESPARRPNDVKQRTYRLPLPPIAITVPNNPPLSTTTTPSAPSSPAIAENLTSPRSGWKKGQLLGRGTFGHVYLGFNSENGEMCAMKEVTLFSDDAKSKESAQQLAQEIALLSSLRHPNIVQYYGSETVDDKIYIYLEYVSGGSIYKLLQQYGPLGEIAIRNYTRQILLGLAYLHSKNTVHRDIKAANILVDPNGRVKLADFGMAKHISGQPCALSLKGSPFWMAPEVIKNSSGCNTAVDIWSLGCTVLEMATTKPPWSEYEGVAAMFKIGYSKELPAMPDNLSEEGKDFIRLCLQRNPDSRPPATQFLMHPFVRNVAAERPILSGDPSEAKPALVNAMRSLAIVPAKHKSGLASEAAGTHLSRSSRTVSGTSDVHTPRNISHPVSPTVRSLHGSERLSPSPISSPHTASGSSTPPNGGTGAVPYHHTRQLTFSLEDTSAFQVPQTSHYSNANTPISSPRTASPTGGIGAVPFHETKQPTFSYEGVSAIPRPRYPHYSNANTAYQDPNHDQRWRVTQGTFARPDIVSSNSNARGNQNRRVGQGFSREFHHGKSHLHDRV